MEDDTPKEPLKVLSVEELIAKVPQEYYRERYALDEKPENLGKGTFSDSLDPRVIKHEKYMAIVQYELACTRYRGLQTELAQCMKKSRFEGGTPLNDYCKDIATEWLAYYKFFTKVRW